MSGFRPFDPVGGGGGSSGLDNRVIVTSATDLSGTLDSTKEYFIDGIIDMGSQSIEVPQGGINFTGYNFDLSKLISSAAAYTMFTSPAGGSGDFLGKDYAIEVTGVGSQVYDIVSDTGFEAFEFSRINYNDCSSLGTIDNYRQGLEVGTGRFGGKPELTLKGTWVGGYFIDTSIVRGMVDGAYTLFKAGAGFTMASRFRSNQNIDLPANASFFDFSVANFPNPSTIQIDGAIITRNGSIDAEDANINPNITEAELPSAFMGNQGMHNTFVGGKYAVSAEVTTTINTQGVFEVLAGTFTTEGLQHFDQPSNGQARHLGVSPRNFIFVMNMTIAGAQNEEVEIRIRRFDSSSTTTSTIESQVRQVNAFAGGRDVAFFNLFTAVDIDQDDYLFLEVANNSSTANLTVEVDGFFVITER
ncbi:MAG: hypothetical protein COA78_21095 [Blastopirellula sp.]|nr:MAG: hypothetical protein COA78_21095 [Blastopirellula sp.]